MGFANLYVALDFKYKSNPPLGYATFKLENELMIKIYKWKTKNLR